LKVNERKRVFTSYTYIQNNSDMYDKTPLL
jgi:hypothetical protein